MRPRIYLDNAATSWPKPDTVIEAIGDYYRLVGIPAGRGNYSGGDQIGRKIVGVRSAIANLISAGSTDEVIFTCNGTESLNLAILGLLQSGDSVITSMAEHNSVLRPLSHLQQNRNVSVQTVACDSFGMIDVEQLAGLISDETDMVCVTHASNVSGAIQPVKEIGQLCRKYNATLLVDAAQTVGAIRVDVQELGCDLLAASGHKSLLGPLGTGFLYASSQIQDRLTPIRFGGTGTESHLPKQPSSGLARFESGNLNVGGILGLGAGVEFVNARSKSEKQESERRFLNLVGGLNAIDRVRVYSHPADATGIQNVGVLSIGIDGVDHPMDPREIAAMLDSGWGIQTRSGFHCAPLIHEALGSQDQGGTLRLSPGCFTTDNEIMTVMEAISEIASMI